MRIEDSQKNKRADELEFPDTFPACVVREPQGGGKCRHSRARINVIAQRNHSHNPRGAINTTKDTNGGE